MTFLEAAIEVLKREGKPLDVGRLAELAVRHNLLSVVGRDPVGTMQERLDDALEKPDAKMPLFEVKKGTYGLRSYPPRPYPVDEKKTNGHPKGEPAAASKGDVSGEATGEASDETAQTAGARPAAGGEPGPAGEKKKRRRGRRGGRGRRGRREGGEATAAPAGEADETDDDESEETAAAPGEASAAGEAGAEGEAAPGEAAPAEAAAGEDAAAGGEKRARRRSRRGGRGRRDEDREEAAAIAGSAVAAAEPGDDTPTGEHPVVRVKESAIEGDEAVELYGEGGSISPEEAAVIAEQPDAGAAPDDLLTEEAELLDEGDGEDEDFELPGGPLLAPSHGAEEVTRSGDERVVREEILGRRSDERSRRRGHERGRGRDRGARREGAGAREGQRDGAREGQRHEGPRAQEAQRPARHDEKRPERHEPRAEQARDEKRGDQGNLIDVILEVLRSSEGRPMHVRAMADVALKRNLAGGMGGHGDVVRLFRAALVREQRDRETDGLRARVRALGGGHFAPADRKLDPELVPLERELAQASQKLREANRAAVRRRVQRLPPPAFEALGRALLDKLGVTGVELVRRGDGVAYYGGQRQAGVATLKTLVAMRPGENELGRRAIGELRAGLAAKGFDEGILLSGGRLNAEALAELKNGGGVSAHDAESLSALCLRHGLGVRRVQMPIDYLDLELFSELTEA